MTRLSVEQVAERLWMKPATVRRHLAQGDIAAFKAGRRWIIEESAVERYEQAHSNVAAAAPRRRPRKRRAS